MMLFREVCRIIKSVIHTERRKAVEPFFILLRVDAHVCHTGRRVKRDNSKPNLNYCKKAGLYGDTISA